MWEDLEVSLEKVPAENLKTKPEMDSLGFGRHFTDHMLWMKWSRTNGWHDAKICPLQDFQMHPASMVFHYGQAIFEGLKAYRGGEGDVYLFRPLDNLERMCQSAIRMCMPRLPVEKTLAALKALVYLDREWVPQGEGASLYIRPTMIATDGQLGVRPSDSYFFFVIMSPVGPYYPEGCNPTKIYVSDEYVRAVKGGVGSAKAAGNYAASLYMSELAKKQGFTQVLWLDACEHKYVEEVGTSNIFFRIDDRLITPALEGSILAGITRDSVIKMVSSWGIEVEQRPISIDEVLDAQQQGTLQEVFGTGTAAVISPVGELYYREKSYLINNGKTGELAERLYSELQRLQRGEGEDPFNWRIRVA